MWEGTLPVTFRYQLLADTSVITPFGVLPCHRIQGIGSSNVGTTALDSYFHPTYGFVRLRYHNIKQTRLDLDMIQVDMQAEDYQKVNDRNATGSGDGSRYPTLARRKAAATPRRPSEIKLCPEQTTE